MLAASQSQEFSVLLLLVVTIALIYDLRYQRIPNWLTAFGLIAGLGLHSWFQGYQGFLKSLAGASIGLAVFLPFYARQAMGAGDVKLMAAVGANMALPFTLHTVCAVLISGGLAGAIYFIALGGFRDLISRYTLMAKTLSRTGQLVYQAPGNGSVAKRRFPYASAIWLGTVSVMIITDQLAPESFSALTQITAGLPGK